MHNSCSDDADILTFLALRHYIRVWNKIKKMKTMLVGTPSPIFVSYGKAPACHTKIRKNKRVIDGR